MNEVKKFPVPEGVVIKIAYDDRELCVTVNGVKYVNPFPGTEFEVTFKDNEVIFENL